MAKRSADKELTADNWNEDEKKGDSSFGVTAPLGGTSSSTHFLLSREPESTAVSEFSGVTSTSMAVPAVNSIHQREQPQSSGAADEGSDFIGNLRALNESFIHWLGDNVKKNPYCLLTPSFYDYEKYVTELNQDFPRSPVKTSGGMLAAAVGSTVPSTSTGASSSAVSPLVVSDSQAAASATAVTDTSAASKERGNAGLVPPKRLCDRTDVKLDHPYDVTFRYIQEPWPLMNMWPSV